MFSVGVLLFDQFQTLDVFGPVEVFGRNQSVYQVRFYSLHGEAISNDHGILIYTEPLSAITEEGVDVLVIPGGHGTRKMIENAEFIDALRHISILSEYVLTVCTGSALLAKTGLLKNKKATTNKKAYHWVTATSPDVAWQQSARWVVDGKFYTSSGVSAGTDMSLGFLSDQFGSAFARKVARDMEYNWQEDKDQDPFTNNVYLGGN